MGYMIGIDLGTTNTAICAIIDGRPKMLENETFLSNQLWKDVEKAYISSKPYR